MDIAITILSILHVFIALLLVLIVLWQRPRQEGLGASFGGGMTEQMFGAQTTNVLQKGTVWLSVVFFANTMVIATLMANQTKAKRASGLLEEKSAVVAPAQPEAVSAAPAAPGSEAPASAPVAPASEAPAPQPPADSPAAESTTPAAPEEPTPAPAPAQPAPQAPEPAAPAETQAVPEGGAAKP